MFFHLPLELYRARYTCDLLGWEQAVFRPYFGDNYLALMPPGSTGERPMQAGTVLDKWRRPTVALQQVLELLTYLKENQDSRHQVYLSDFFTPGIEALAYALDAGDLHYAAKEVTLGAFWWAQSVDRYDFTRNLQPWITHYERMVGSLCRHLFVACSELGELISVAYPEFAPKVRVVGLPYDSKAVLRSVDLNAAPRDSAPYDVVYAGRWDVEKRPDFFLDLVLKHLAPTTRVLVCTGQPEVTGNDVKAIDALMALVQQGRITLKTGLARTDYFNLLGRSKVLFNCALQDWVSFTLLDGLTMGCLPVYPCHRSFPQAVGYHWPWLYAPYNAQDAKACIEAAISRSDAYRAGQLTEEASMAAAIVGYHDATLRRIVEVFSGKAL